MRFRGNRYGDKRVKKRFAFIPVYVDSIDKYVWLESYYSHQRFGDECYGTQPCYTWNTITRGMEVDKTWI